MIIEIDMVFGTNSMLVRLSWRGKRSPMSTKTEDANEDYLFGRTVSMQVQVVTQTVPDEDRYALYWSKQGRM